MYQAPSTSQWLIYWFVCLNKSGKKQSRERRKGQSEKISGVQQRKSLSLRELLVLTLVVSLMEKFNHFQ